MLFTEHPNYLKYYISGKIARTYAIRNSQLVDEGFATASIRPRNYSLNIDVFLVDTTDGRLALKCCHCQAMLDNHLEAAAHLADVHGFKHAPPPAFGLD